MGNLGRHQRRSKRKPKGAKRARAGRLKSETRDGAAEDRDVDLEAAD